MLAEIAVVWSFAVASVATWAAIRRPRHSAFDPQVLGPLLVLRPCAAHEPCLEEALASSRAAGPEARVVFLVASETDSAFPVARAAAEALRADSREASVLVTRARGPNSKADQLSRAVDGRPEVPSAIVVADSDVLLSEGVIRSLLAPLAAGQADATWAPPIETRPVTSADQASAALLDASMHAFPVLAGLDPRGMVGKLFAIRRDALEAAGGFGGLVRHLGEDMELARRLRAVGRTVRAIATPAEALARGRSWSEVLARYARWVTVIRAQRRALLVSYPLLFTWLPFATGIALASIAVEGAERGALALGAVIAARVVVSSVARRLAGARGLRAFGPVVAADLLLLAAFCRALASRTVRWRGAALELRADGTLAEVIR